MMKYEDEMKFLKTYETCEMKEKYEKLEKIAKNIEIPEKLYRYRPLNIYTIDELISKHVFLSSPNIDDIFDTTIVNNGEVAEGVLAAVHVAKRLSTVYHEMNENYKMYTEYFEYLNNRIRENIRITCFT